jgi:two-component system, OmpR family, phosphate regulon sensor histidine kinase PhoR
VDPIVVAFISLLAVLLAIATAVALSRGRELDDIREQTAARDPADDLAGRVRHLIEDLDATAYRLEGAQRDLAYLIELMGTGIVRLDDDRRIELANAAAHTFLERPAGSLRGMGATGAFLDVRIEAILESARELGSASGEVRLRSDGPVLLVRARRSPVRGLWLVLEDVSELRRLQQIRAEFIDNLSHELRTPLTTVSLLAETLTREADVVGDAIPAKMRDRIGKIEVETGHLVQMVNELLDLARIESGGPLAFVDDLDLGRIASEAAERLRLFAERQGLGLVVDVAPGVPRIRGDEARLGQVVVNLVHNALKFGRPEDADRAAAGDREAGAGEAEQAAEVRVIVDVVDREVRLRVVDHGVGIPAADQARIFERFYKVDRVRVRGGGTGLGLAIARHVIQQHGGRISVTSEEGKGSTFTVLLPVPGAERAA